MSIPGMEMIFQGGQQDPGQDWASQKPLSSWDHHASRLASLCQVYFSSKVLAARNIPFLHVNPTQSASWPGLWFLQHAQKAAVHGRRFSGMLSASEPALPSE